MSVCPGGQLKVTVVPTIAGFLLSSTISVWESSKIKSAHLAAMDEVSYVNSDPIKRYNLR